jgi:antitoxin Phd
MRTWQVQEARRQFRQLFEDAVEKGPQRVARQGKRAVVVVSEEEWQRLADAVPSFGELLASCPIEPADLPKRRPARALRQLTFD